MASLTVLQVLQPAKDLPNSKTTPLKTCRDSLGVCGHGAFAGQDTSHMYAQQSKLSKLRVELFEAEICVSSPNKKFFSSVLRSLIFKDHVLKG